ncbi:hypothetical protein GIB67_009800 [Kingdonia uniflora]|uniref:Gamma-soluble NSF attachment protein n=1 Tax=Kingdonia uniflora TaxID=39325 RepID=A0A7J7LXI5_9MAGN|nr:hypothetical protein GIB67_009800 [Kingdonia uniflora]
MYVLVDLTAPTLSDALQSNGFCGGHGAVYGCGFRGHGSSTGVVMLAWRIGTVIIVDALEQNSALQGGVLIGVLPLHCMSKLGFYFLFVYTDLVLHKKLNRPWDAAKHMDSCGTLAKELGSWSEVADYYRRASELYTECGRSQPGADSLARGARYALCFLPFIISCLYHKYCSYFLLYSNDALLLKFRKEHYHAFLQLP